MNKISIGMPLVFLKAKLIKLSPNSAKRIKTEKYYKVILPFNFEFDNGKVL